MSFTAVDSIKKGVTVLNTSALLRKEDTPIPVGTGFACLRGGKYPRLAYWHAGNMRFETFQCPSKQLMAQFIYAPAHVVPVTLALHLDLPTEHHARPTLIVGQHYRSLTNLACGQVMMVSAGDRLRCESSTNVVLMSKFTNKGRHIVTLPAADLSLLVYEELIETHHYASNRREVA